MSKPPLHVLSSTRRVDGRRKITTFNTPLPSFCGRKEERISHHQANWFPVTGLHNIPSIFQSISRNKTSNVHVTLGRVRVTAVAVASIKYYIFWVCMCSLRYPACNAHAPYCHLWPFRLKNIFPTLSHKQRDFPENNFFFMFSTTFSF
jgi:hypothetical protein